MSFERNKNERGKFHYEYFSHHAERRDIYIFCKELATYLHNEDIKNILFLDRSARPAWVGVDEYWNQTFIDTKKPGFYFINPDGLKAAPVSLITDIHEIESTMLELLATGKVSPLRTENEIGERFSEIYSNLLEDRDKPLVLFDTCAHTGSTIKPVKNFLHSIGFKDIRIITANTPDDESEVDTVARVDMDSQLTSCYPFGRDSVVQKGDDVISEPVHNKYNTYWGNMVRTEIRQIMKEYLK